jgi:hypothetical protein
VSEDDCTWFAGQAPVSDKVFLPSGDHSQPNLPDLLAVRSIDCLLAKDSGGDRLEEEILTAGRQRTPRASSLTDDLATLDQVIAIDRWL